MLAKFSVKKPYTVLVVIALVVVLGVVSLTRMTADLLPSMNLPYAIVMTTYPGASPQEVEEGVTKPIESAMATTSNIKHISSNSAENFSLVILEFEQNANMDSVTIEMRESLDQITGYFPESVSNPIIMKMNPDMLPIMVAAADVDGMDRTEISQYVESELVPELESVEGVASVSVVGSIEETIRVTLSQEKIDAVNEKIKASLDESFAEAKQEMEEAKDELASGKDELENGQQELADTVSEAQNELNDKKTELMLTESDLNSKLAELKETRVQVEQGIAGLTQMQEGVGQLKTALEQLSSAREQLLAGKEQLSDAKEEISKAREELSTAKETLSVGIKAAELMPPEMQEAAGINLEELRAQYAQVEQQLNEIETKSAEVDQQYAEVERQSAEVEQQYEALQQQYAALEQQAAAAGTQMGMENVTLDSLPALIGEMNGKLAQIDAGIAQMEEALVSISEGKTTINEALSQLNKSQILGAIQMGSASAQINSGEQKMEETETAFEEQQDEAYEKASLDSLLTIDMVKNLLTAQNFSMPAGYVTEEKQQYLIRVGDKAEDLEELSELALMDMGMDGVDLIRLSDVADVELVTNEEEVYASVNGNPGVMLSIEKQTGYSTGDVTDRVLERFESLSGSKDGLHTTVLMDQGIYIDMIVDSVLQNMIVGGILAVIILLLFLKDVKPTIVIACAIPVSVIFAVVLMYFSGITLNVISLSGLALGIGMLVDNSIVVIENIYRMRKEGESVKYAAIEGTKQVAGAIMASTLTTICVFAPIIFTEGITRQLFVDMGLTIAYCLIASLLIALTFVPMMASGLLKRAGDKKHPLFDRLQESYGRALRVLLRFKPVVFLVVLALLAVSVLAALTNGTAFMADMESPQLTVTITPPEEADITEAGQLSEEVMERLSDIEDIETIGAMAGGQGLLSSGGNTVSMYLLLKDEPELNNAQLTKEIMERTKDLDGEISVNSAAMDMNMLSGSGISVMIKGRDLDKMQEIAKEIASLVSEVEGTREVSDGMEETVPQFKITVDKEKAAEYNMTVAQVFQLINEKLAGESRATTLSTDIKDYEVYVAGEDVSEVTRQEIRDLTFVYTDKEGEETDVPLRDIVTFEETEGLSAISRDAQERYITVTAAIDEEHNVGLVAREVQQKLDRYQCPAGFTLEMAGEDETINEAIEQVLLMLLLAVIFVYLIMVAQFQSLLSPFIIMFTLPLAFTGGFFALFITGSEVSVIALIGFVMLCGIIVNNGIVMVDYTNQLRQAGMEKKEALVEAGKTRLRPILMTALTTIIAMSTMALGLDSGSEMVQPMAVVVVGGMVYGTLLTLVVVPCIYDAFHRDKSIAKETYEE